jgi:hypothetical protein
MTQAESYVGDREDDITEMKKLNQVALQVDEREDGPAVNKLADFDIEHLGEHHLAAIYEEVDDLRFQVS